MFASVYSYSMGSLHYLGEHVPEQQVLGFVIPGVSIQTLNSNT